MFCDKFDQLQQLNTQYDKNDDKYDFEYQLNVFKQFCDTELEISQFSKEYIRNKYKSFWNDFVTIRVNLINGKLFNLFKNLPNIDTITINEFYKQCFSYYRDRCVSLPSGRNRFDNRWCFTTPNDTRRDIYRFIVIWNGVSAMFRDEDLKDSEKNISIIRQHMCDELVKTNIFGHYWYNPQDTNKKESNEKVYNLCIKALFNNNFDELNKLISYCINENISNIEEYETDEDMDMIPFIVNELSYLVFHDLTIDSWYNNNNNNNNMYQV